MSVTAVTAVSVLVHLLNQDDGSAPATVFGYAALAVAWLLAVPLNYYEHVNSIRSSDVIFLFYVLSIVALSIEARTLRLLSNYSEGFPVQLCSALFMISTLLIGFIVEAWPRSATKVQQCSSAPIYDKANLFSQITYFFYLPIIRLGNTKSLTAEDLTNQLPECVYTAASQPLLDQHWKANQDSAAKRGKEPSLFRAVLRSQLIHAPGLFLIRITRVLTNFTVPAILSLLLAYFQDIQDPSSSQESDKKQPGSGGTDHLTRSTSLEYGIFLVFAMSFAGLCNVFLLAVSRQYCFTRGLEVRSALVSMIYHKALKLSPGSRQLSTTGQILNHVSIDADDWVEGGLFLTMWISVPLEIFSALYLLHRTLGWSAWVGLLTMMSMTPLQIWRVKIYNRLHRQRSELADERIRVMTEILSAIKLVKLYAWESPFLTRILNVRNRELGAMRRAGALDAAMSIVFSSSPLIISFVTLSVYAIWGGPGFTPGALSPQVVFVSITLFGMLKNPISTLTETTSATVRIIVSTSRIQQFLLREETEYDAIVRELDESKRPFEEPSIVVQDATFSWSKKSELVGLDNAENQDDADETQGLLQESQDSESTGIQRPTLQNISLSVKSGSLVAIVGRVGQGKSSLLSALIGEMYKFHGFAKTVGRIAYVPQQSWILNATLRDNILFGLEYDQGRYERIIAASGLEPDLVMLPAGDQTEIGERGINLSGGQKQRVSLARAAYNDADIYLLDDPLSAVDAHVDQHLWRELIGPQGLLRNKTRLLVTHGIHHLQDVDQIILLKDGCVAESGHFEDLMDAGQTFCQLISDYAITHRDQGDSGATSGSGSDIAETQSQETVASGASGDAEANTATSKHGDVVKDVKRDRKAGIIKEETSNAGELKLSVFLTYLRAMTYKYTVLIVFCHVLIQLCSVATTLWLKYWIGQSSKIDDQRNPTSLKFFLSVFALLTLICIIAGMILKWVSFGVALIRASEYLHRKFISRIMLLPPSFFDTTPLGRIINIASSDFASIDGRIPAKLYQIISQGVAVITSLAVVAFTTPLCLFASPFIAVIYFLIQKYYLHASQAAKRVFSVTKSPVFQHFQETLAGVSTIRAMRLQDRFAVANSRLSDIHANAFVAYGYCIRWMEIQVQIINVIITLLAGLWFVLLPQGSVNAATAGLALSFAMSNAQALIWVTRHYCDMYLHLIAIERVEEYSEMNTEAPRLTAPDSEAGRALEHHWPQNGRIEFVDYSTRYREGMDLVLRSISFKVEGGQKIGIVGRTGAGKSSLTLALFRMIEAANSEWARATNNSSNQEPQDLANEEDQLDGGKIEIDNVDISTLGLADLRKNLSIIPQEPVLFAGTVRENLDPFGELEDVVLWEALERSYLKSVIAALPGGLLFQVAQNGENFSVGQKSLICLARALLRKTKILVLDEATSAVDIETDELIQKTIRTEFKDRTILTIAHRIKTVMDSDKILVLDHGRIVEFDSPKVLLKDESSLFYKLAKRAGET
ncbi:Multidrug resistance-associated protein 1 [Linnemannia gamsii]|uniref:Multidrug resistance-associated protein 1 n=1 Tax=Linnemannia gamsii TaxID=64522 RepID=A0ABQ7KHU7_9FUNG|nr:Multidrug resistance-associated protein 1 [Linnemannia gamsii]